MKPYFLLITFLCFYIYNSYSQIAITNPFEDRAFTKNEGQWLKEEKETNRHIYFGAMVQGKQVFITNKGLVYKYLDYYNKKKDFFEKWLERKNSTQEEEEGDDFYKKGEYLPKYVFVNYDGINSQLEISENEKTRSYTSYADPLKGNQTIKAFAYKKITLKNCYSKIDIEFTITSNGGFEYQFILKPYADANLIKLSYQGVSNLYLTDNNELQLVVDGQKKLTETAPISFIKQTNQAIISKRTLLKNTQQFILENYDKSQEVVIDPIVFNPLLTSYNKAYDLSKDNAGNILVFGGLCPYVLKKFSSTGVLLWSFDWSTINPTATLYGDFAVDQNDNVIMLQGYPNGRVIKTDPNGVIILNTIAGNIGSSGIAEFWRIAYNCDYSTLRVSGYADFFGGFKQMMNMDPATGTVISASPSAIDESRALFVSPLGDIYSLTPSQVGVNPAANFFTKFDVSLTSVYRVVSGYNTTEGQGIYQNVSYGGGASPFANMNAITADVSNVYTYDGSTIYKRRQNTGTSVGSIVIPNGVTLGNSGIVIDPCFNIFVGTQNGVVRLDTNLTIINTIATPAQVYDLCLYNGHILATGNGFVNELNFNTSCNLTVTTTTIANTRCTLPFNGVASITNITNGIMPYTYLWSNGATTPSITALAPGKYWVLTKDAYCGNPKTSVDTVIIPNTTTIPTASFSVNNSCLGTVTSFSNLSTPIAPNTFSVSTWDWDFTSNNTIDVSTQNPTFTYTAAGTYSVTLFVKTNADCKDTLIIPLTIFANPVASFSSDSVCLSSTSHIINTSTLNISTSTNYQWDFTNDNIADVTGPANINYTFPNAGNNIVGYTVTTTPVVGLTCKKDTTQNVWVNALPQPAFSFTNHCINAQPNAFDASASSISIGTNTNYAWAFGDSQLTTSVVATTTHTYVAAGIYNTTLTVTSNKGCISSVSHQVEVYKKPMMSIAVSPLICLGSATSFTAVSAANSAVVVSWDWDMNNTLGTIEVSGQSNVYTFATAGTQTIALISTTRHGCKDTISRNAYVNYIPTPNFTVDKPKGCPLPHCVKFKDSSTVTLPAQIKTWEWAFGDGTSTSNSTNTIQSHCYTNSSSNQLALFTVTLTTTTDSGCVAFNVKPNMITVYPKPIANYTIVPEFGNVVVPLVHFINQSVDYTKWYWSFGDGPQIDSTNVNPDHTYISEYSNKYHSILVVANAYGCLDTAYVLVDIAPDFSFYIPNAFTPNNDNVNDKFTGAGIGIIEYEMWIFDRWGENVFYTDDITKGWNGKVQGKDADVKDDVYTWKVILKNVFNKTLNYVGHVTLLR